MKAWLEILTVIGGLALAGSACRSNPLAEGQREMAAGNYAKAVEVFKAVRDQRPDDPRVHSELGLAYAKQDKSDEAMEAYKKAIQLDPAFPEAHFNLGTLYLRLGGYPEAEAELNLAVKYRPDYVKAYNNLGLGLMSMGKFDEAEESFKKAIELDPNDSVYRENLQYCQDAAKSTREHLKGLAEEKRKEEEKKSGGTKPAGEAKPTGATPPPAPEKAAQPSSP